MSFNLTLKNKESTKGKQPITLITRLNNAKKKKHLKKSETYSS